GWRDRDSVFYSPAFEEEEMTTSGYPRRVYLWERGTPASAATLVYEAGKEDMLAYGMRIWDQDSAYDFVVKMPTFYTQEQFLYRDATLHRLDLPADAKIAAVINGQLLVELRSSWQRGGVSFGQGALIAASIDAVVRGDAAFVAVFQPGPRQSVQGVSTTRSTVLVSVLDNVVGGLISYTFDGQAWQQKELAVPTMGSVDWLDTSRTTDRFFYRYTGFLSPTSIFEADAGCDEHHQVRSEPAWFDATTMQATQHEAKSADGTMVPYFLVAPRDFVADGRAPTLLEGYGGFEISMTPYYSGVLGESWLSRGGVYVLANIRGGGEFGPAWHQAALKENRQRAFDDFIAVADDLIARKITSPAHLGIQGGSNGGLLVASVMVQRPELFGAVVCEVPLLDMQRYHRLLAGASWMAEYGNPDEPGDWAYLSAYSPYQNVRAGVTYPKVFFTTSTRDDRVHPGHARRMVARMLDQGHDVLYYENVEGGHGGAANQRQRAHLHALIYSYLHERLAPDAGRVP
ncbi:MAG: S9 family peptidase, partial [Bradymonadaceae bacterium]|nr:S9 family peptidase [Lujinxingiaceae bacterium]